MRMWQRRRNKAQDFLADQHGATVVEFAFVAMPFFGLLFVILQTALVFWSTQVLDTAVTNAARELYTGEFQKDPTLAGKSSSDLLIEFKKRLCNNLGALLTCDQVAVDVKTFTSFSGSSGASVPRPVKNGAYDTSGYGYTAPASNDIVVVRASAEYPTFTGFVPATTLSNGKQLIMASTTFRAEPF